MNCRNIANLFLLERTGYRTDHQSMRGIYFAFLEIFEMIFSP